MLLSIFEELTLLGAMKMAKREAGNQKICTKQLLRINDSSIILSLLFYRLRFYITLFLVIPTIN